MSLLLRLFVCMCYLSIGNLLVDDIETAICWGAQISGGFSAVEIFYFSRQIFTAEVSILNDFFIIKATSFCMKNCPKCAIQHKRSYPRFTFLSIEVKCYQDKLSHHDWLRINDDRVSENPYASQTVYISWQKIDKQMNMDYFCSAKSVLKTFSSHFLQ